MSEAQSEVNSSGAAPGLLSDSQSEELVRELWWSALCKLHHHGQRLPRKERRNTHKEGRVINAAMIEGAEPGPAAVLIFLLLDPPSLPASLD